MESQYIYFFSPFSLFMSVYLYGSVSDFVYIALLLPFVLWFVCTFLFVCLFVFLVYFLALLIIGGFVFWFDCFLFSFFFFYYFKKNFNNNF